MLVKAGYQMSSDEQYVMCDPYPDSDTEEEDEDYDDARESTAVCPGPEEIEESWSTDEEAEGFQASRATLQCAQHLADNMCHLCYKTMTRDGSDHTVCTYCHRGHCLACHLARYQDTKTFDDQYLDWIPSSYYPVRHNVPDFNNITPQHSKHVNNVSKTMDFQDTKTCDDDVLDWTPYNNCVPDYSWRHW